MDFLDVRTLIINHIFSAILCTIMLGFVWLQNRKRISGLGYWLANFILYATSMVLIASRGILPDWLSIIVANGMLILGIILFLAGLAEFIGEKYSQTHNFFLLAVFILLHFIFTFIKPDLGLRAINIGLASFILNVQSVWLIFFKLDAERRRIMQEVGGVTIFLTLISLGRILANIFNPPDENNLFSAGSYEAAIMLTYQVVIVLLAFSLAIMVNKSLLGKIQFQEKKYALVFRSSPYAITVTRLSDGMILDVNEGFTKVTGYEYSEAVGRTVGELELWGLAEGCEAIVQELAQFKTIKSREYPLKTKSGRIITGLFSFEIITLHDQPWVLSSIEDVTQQKQFEAELKLAHDRLQATLDALPDLLFEVDVDGKIHGFHSQRAERFYLPSTAFLGKSIPALLPADAAKVVMDSIQRALEAKVDFGAVYSIDMPNGRHWYELSTSVMGEKKPVERLLLLVRDITERKQAEEALYVNERLFRAMIENASDAVTLLDASGSIVYESPSSVRITGYGINEQMGRNGFEVIHPDDKHRVQAEFARLAQVPGGTAAMEMRTLHKKGYYLNLDCAATNLLDDPTVRAIVINFHDITERKKLQEQDRERVALEERQHLARDLHDAVSQTLFSASVTAEMLLQQKKTISQRSLWKNISYFAELVKSALGEMRILLLELRPEGLTHAELPGLLEQLVDAARSRIEAEIELEIRGSGKPPVEVKIAFYRIAQESINNIIKHANSTNIQIRLANSPDLLQMTIEDNGVGIQETESPGPHLGLNIMRERANETGTKLEITSVPGQGTRVTCIWVPGRVSA
ncbi:MAG: PAS domain S-box protein [Anaerolineales bacterium]|nr:PAS domain S-box protein [Anaerolineales bacterium]